jgi:FixJ family two-component response regulator
VTVLAKPVDDSDLLDTIQRMLTVSSRAAGTG